MPEYALAITIGVVLLILVAVASYKRGYSEGVKAGREYQRRYGDDGVPLDLSGRRLK